MIRSVARLLLAGCLLAPALAAAQGPWAVALTPTMNPLPVGFCGALQLTLFDQATKDVPRNPLGQRVTIADFDISVTSPDGRSAAVQYLDAYHVLACGCKGAVPGTVGTVTATYPAQALAAKARVPGVALQKRATFTLSAPKGDANPPECTALATAPPQITPTLVELTAAPAPAAPPQAAPVTPARTPVALTPDPAASVTTAAGRGAPIQEQAPPSLEAGPTRAPAPGPGPAPMGVSVTGTPGTATLTWQPVAGVSSYVVTRQQANVTAAPQPLASANTGMYDSGLQPATLYSWTVRAIQADGREGSTKVTYTTPAAENPAGFTASQTGAGRVSLSWQPVDAASYYVVFGPGAQGGTKVTGATSHTVTGVPLGPQEWTVASYYDPGAVSSVGTEFTKASLTVTLLLLTGWVDLHTHPMINLAFGGKLVHGGPDIGSLLPADASCQKGVRATTIEQALGDDRPSHGGFNLLHFPCGDDLRKLLLNQFQSGNHARTTASPANGFPNFDQWPKWDDITHQKMWFEWIRRARDGGLRVMVALTTNNKTLADAMSGGSPITGTADGATDDKSSGNLQLAEIKAFVERHNDFMEVALNSADVKRIVLADKIAVVMGVELDNFGNFNTVPGMATLPPAAAQVLISNEVQRLHDLGARYIFPVHVLDNPFGGTAIYEDGFNTSNLRESGNYWDVECADVSDGITHKYKLGTDLLGNILKSAFALVKLGIDPLRHPGPPPVCPGGQPGKSFGHRNAKGLTPNGVIAVKEMMKRGMIVDIDHMSQKTADATLTIAETFGYPLVSGHTGIRGQGDSNAENSRTPLQLQRLSKLQGMFGLGSAGVHAYQWARHYNTALGMMGYLNPDPAKKNYLLGGVSFGTDLNGLVQGPKPGGGNRVKYGPAFPMSRTVAKEWDYNTEGVAHYGMLADFVKDVQTAPSTSPGGLTGTELVDNHLNRSANYFWQMWERIEAKKGNVQ